MREHMAPHRRTGPEYVDVCHPAKGQPHTAIVLWSHDGTVLESRSAKGGKGHNDFEWFAGQRPRIGSDGMPDRVGIHDADGRVDTRRKVGTLAFAPNIGRRRARRIAEDVIAEFPGVRFWVFHESDWGATMQEFWEATS